MVRRPLSQAALLLLLACTPPAPVIRPQMEPRPDPRTPEIQLPADSVAVAVADPARRVVPPEEAWQRGLMPLHSTGIPGFASAMPDADGRGVLIAILDSGIDPSVPGLQRTPDGNPKLLDVRDFSGEGRITLTPVVRRGDTLIVAGQRLLGAARIAGVAAAGEWWGGALDELPLGAAPSADIDGNGTVGDRLPVVVVRTTGGLVLFADTQGNGTFADDKPLRDYAVARDMLAWQSGVSAPMVQMAVNLADSSGTPLLDLVFDTSAHGTHVAGIAAGHDLYGVRGFDGTAPGARLLALKIANDAQGGITVTRSMIRALDHAIRFAADRKLPLVVNISFGVGNEREGAARIDAMLDSILVAHPTVVVTVAAANDGPGLSTLGFPGSAGRILSVGASLPLVFNGLPADDPTPEPLAPFSSRGGEFSGPDLVVPGVAYSTVPNFAIGNEVESGTSMAAPHAAGLAARLLSALGNRAAALPAHVLIQALRTAAHPVPGATAAEQGAGMPDLLRAWTWLARRETAPEVAIDVPGGVSGRAAIYATLDAGANRPVDATLSLRRVHPSDGPMTVRLIPSAPWIAVPATLTLGASATIAPVRLSPATRSRDGAIRVEDAGDGSLVGVVPVTLRVPMSSTALTTSDTVTVAAGATAHFFVPAEAGRGFQIEVATASASEMVTASLHEPGGMPFREGGGMPAGFGDGAALFELEGNDVVDGLYEMAIVAGPLGGAGTRITVRRAPLRIEASVRADSLRVTTTSLVDMPLSVRTRVGLIGAEWQDTVRQANDRPVRLAVPVPDWAERVIVDSRMPREAWPRFTDFGVTFQDRAGRHIDASPLNYAFGRAMPELPGHVVGDSLIILLAPAFADRSEPWELAMSVRFYAEDVVEIDDGGAPFLPLAPRAVDGRMMRLGTLPRTLPPGFRPVLILVALEGDDNAWTREIALDMPGRVYR
jgi:subtilisin family serine protease